ncbi:hypothetical protein SHELI_v1c09400 [Spiroplasma helicoides]|uniref:Lipoprotein n=1 Tax=Spiroplasma helicoides TaxID=216938 RepID=A0A1B3SLS3_9MOLU|nr:lipoprotein [Spiroplasma helicoides]AOG60889.1 hypothetical protein SHELI_v1c09400 [Spiroplasma helicoides]
MKKLLSVLAATGLVASSSSVAVACNKQEAEKNLTYVEGKSDKDFVAKLSEKIVKDKKLADDFKDIVDSQVGEYKMTMDGTPFSVEGEFYGFFNETKDYKNVKGDTESTGGFFSLKGEKDATSFKIFFVEVKITKGVEKTEAKTLYTKTVNIPQE